MAQKLSYHDTVNYSQADPMKVLAQKQGLATNKNMPFGYQEVPGTRGESAYVFSMGKTWGALVQEGLGTKSLIAQSLYEATGTSYFPAIARDTVACIINDLVSVGATPVVLNAYWSSSSYQWLADQTLAESFIIGWREACDMARVVWGGGETQSLSGVVEHGKLEFAGSAFGTITNKRRLISGANLRAGDAIVLIESNGVHANGISLIREIAKELPDGYQTMLADGSLFGETVLQASHIYTELVEALFSADVDVHYLSNITGHGWRKIMRATQTFSYILTMTPEVPELFNFIAEKSDNDEREMYGNYNMGAGYAIYVPEAQAKTVIAIAYKVGLRAWQAGRVEAGPRKVVIESKNITYNADALEVR
jgi:phosphoribosylformylglycinamidine cyclo-ligase